VPESLYREDLAYIQAAAYGWLARGAAPEIVRLLRSAAIPVRRVVDVGCGAGPLTSALVEAGFEVTGIDPSAELLGIARNRAPSASFLQASIYETEIPKCQAIVAVGEPLSYHAEGCDAEKLLQDFFQRASAVLPVGGMLVFDVIEAGGPSLAGRTWNAGEDWAVLVETIEGRGSQTLVREIETFRLHGELYRRGREVHTVRLFDSESLLKQLSTAGFAAGTAQAYGSQALGPRRRAFICTLCRAPAG
jgi:SAM-dependent methyltransferase